MNLQAEKIQLVKQILDTDNERLLKAVKNLFKNWHSNELSSETFSLADSIETGLKELKLHQEGKVKLKLAKDLLNEL